MGGQSWGAAGLRTPRAGGGARVPAKLTRSEAMTLFQRTAGRHKPGMRMQEQLRVAVHRIAPPGVQ
jgi:hypothetical protein